ncbi:hypothetical protein GCM10029964_061970 [Kibdelosporangium lantanae]
MTHTVSARRYLPDRHIATVRVGVDSVGVGTHTSYCGYLRNRIQPLIGHSGAARSTRRVSTRLDCYAGGGFLVMGASGRV